MECTAVDRRTTLSVEGLTRALVDLDSTSGREAEVGTFVGAILEELAARGGGRVERFEVEPGRFNLFLGFGQPVVTLSTHLDCVPPFLPSREDETWIWGRGACDAKGSAAAMLCAADRLLAEGEKRFGLLFVVGEENGSAGARHAARHGRGSRYLINGEPTENRLAVGCQGVLRLRLEATGRPAHSGYPELGDSAIDKLLEVLARIRALPLPEDPRLGRSTLTIGQIGGGRAPNVIPDEAWARLMFRLVGPADSIRHAVTEQAQGLAAVVEELHVPPVVLGQLEGFPTTVVRFASDIPLFEGQWGEPFLLGPGSIAHAHMPEERVAKSELAGAVSAYFTLVKRLLAA